MRNLLIYALATWRLAHMLMYEYGPFGAFHELRRRTGIIHDDLHDPIMYPSEHVLQCMWCTSMWTSFVIVLVPRQLRWALAASALAIGIHYGKSEYKNIAATGQVFLNHWYAPVARQPNIS